ncbi:YihY/virulence factor BrkB family protein [Streptomyces sp. NPDC006393]|uniref:YihY/virulence factor BrkB family protein n=1 Tax=Streptomyces sp. NPDC006393 TaxID=3156763 RepID=UPI00340991F9
MSIWNDDVADWAASLTYYSVLSIFPTLLVTVSLVGLAGPGTVRDLIGNVNAVVPAESRAVIEGTLKDMAHRHAATWLVVVLGTMGALWSASSYLAVFRRALHAMYDVEDHRPVWRTVPRNVITALVLLGLFVSSAGALMLTGELARTAGRLMGMGDAAETTWTIVKWPLLLLLAAVLVLVLFHTGPAPARGLAMRALGGALAVVLWLIASVGFAFYASLVGTYNRLYGSLTGIIVFFVWLWVSNLALLTGAQFNAELVKLQNAER